MKKQDEIDQRDEALANWLDEVLEQPENHQVLENGDILYGYHGEPDTLRELIQEKWFEFKEALGMLWSMKNPFVEHRPILISWIELIRPDLYAIAFPFRFYGKILIGLFSSEERKYAIKQFKNSTLYALLEEMFAMSIITVIVILICLGLQAIGVIA
jgi:hypothetical protein